MNPETSSKIEQLQKALDAGIIDEATFQAAMKGINAKLDGSGAQALGEKAKAAGEGGFVADDVENSTVIFAETGATVVIGDQPVAMKLDRDSALGQYLQHLISRNRYLQLQGIRSGGKLVHIELDRIYIRLRAQQEQLVERSRHDERWLMEAQQLAPGEEQRNIALGARGKRYTITETVTISVEEALQRNQRLIILGDPGSGKTTLTRYLTLLYARDLAEETSITQETLNETVAERLPILMPLRQIGAFLRNRPDEGVDGHDLLLQFLFQSLAAERIDLPANFFDQNLHNGRAVILLDGLDEVADPDLRRRVSRLVERFTAAYPDCRYVVTSRIVGYEGAARLGEEYLPTTVRDFLLADVEQFLIRWHTMLAIGQMGAGPTATAFAQDQTEQLMSAIRGNDRIRDLAINPLMLTVIAMVHRDRVKLPDRRAELYAEAVDVLLGKWDDARGVQEIKILDDHPFDAGDRRLMLQAVALHMHEIDAKEIELDDLHTLLHALFFDITNEQRSAERAVDKFLHVIEARTGLLVARGEGTYAFSHLTFQEYLAALEMTANEDFVTYALKRTHIPWWREVTLLAAGHLSMTSKSRTTKLIQAIADHKEEPQLYHNLVLASECMRDVGSGRVQGDLEGEIQRRLRKDIELDINQVTNQYRAQPTWQRTINRFLSGGPASEEDLIKDVIERRGAAMTALAEAGAGYWTKPFGEPEWVLIPAGEFWMGSTDAEVQDLIQRYEGNKTLWEAEAPQHKPKLPNFQISKTPITNAQYQLFVQATNHRSPGNWEDARSPKGQESHPVINVSWHDAIAYCQWLSSVTGKTITLPSEAEWERAARGNQDKRIYPWGDAFEATRCNSKSLGVGGTTPVGIFPDGASPDGCLDMAGNVWEWTRSMYQPYPYDPEDGRENLDGDGRRTLRGGSCNYVAINVRCAVRNDSDPSNVFNYIGFRVVSPGF